MTKQSKYAILIEIDQKRKMMNNRCGSNEARAIFQKEIDDLYKQLEESE